MTDIQRKAMELANSEGTYKKALFRAIEQHEAFRQEVSDVVEQALSFGDVESLRRKGVLSRFIIPKPKPDPLVEVMEVLNGEWTPDEYANAVRAALDAAGFEIRKKGR